MDESNGWNYLLAHTKNSHSFKKIKRKLSKKHIDKAFDFRSYRNSFDQDFMDILRRFMQRTKHNHASKHVGVITDDVSVIGDMIALPPFPDSWDMICLESEIASYDFNDVKNNVYFTKTSIVDTRHFLINVAAIPKLIGAMNKTKTWTRCVELFSEHADVFTINGEPISIRHQCDNNATGKLAQFTYDPKLADMYPHVSLITPVTNTDYFFNVVYTFLKLQYPRDKLELVIVCDAGNIKKLEKNIPKDPRIKVVNIGNSVTSLSYKLNCGVKYTHQKSSVICHFFDTHCYKNDFVINMTSQLLSKDGVFCVTTADSCFYDSTHCRSYVHKTLFDLGLCMYTKPFWNVRGFAEEKSSTDMILSNFIRNRQGCVDFVTSIEAGFSVIQESSQESLVDLSFDLKCSILDNVESFDLTFKNAHA
jgi:hypothetical protein